MSTRRSYGRARTLQGSQKGRPAAAAPLDRPLEDLPVTSHRITVLGTGYLGATHAVCMAELGYEVLGLDVDKAKIDKLAAGEVPFFEPGLDELLRKNLATGRLEFTTSFEQAGEFGDVHFVCVGTPQKKGEYAA